MIWTPSLILLEAASINFTIPPLSETIPETSIPSDKNFTDDTRITEIFTTPTISTFSILSTTTYETSTLTYPKTKTPSLTPITQIDVFFDDQLIYKTNEKKPSEEPLDFMAIEDFTSTPQQKLLVSTTSNWFRPSVERIVPSSHNFTEQLENFTINVLCIVRFLADLWCIAQCVMAMPFLLGICFSVRCFFIPHLMLAALFIVVLFIFRYV